ncbi:dihydroneopterin aldolase [Prochlorococcus sp. MIT 1300]|uniref:dihydroneopterin aldolase n=1 Tax=Prochlorococcus sp. MIT 1300 TaxID=3096218 RepID=UPI002A7555B8|nr:dihydroneopterin aldolase [Prochlorococcus sp. MIT 1300]
MTCQLPNGTIHVKDIHLWAHVGVYEDERNYGQWFLLDFSLWIDLDRSANDDDLDATADYSIAIRELQRLAFRISCLTLEHFSEEIFILLEDLYGPIPMWVLLRKCSAPVPAFFGTVGVERRRNFPFVT